MTIHIDFTDERAIYVQIKDEIKRALVMEILQAGEPLPSVRQLASDIKVNPNTVKQAYRELEREGLVYVERGKGTFVSHTSRVRIDQGRDQLIKSVAERAIRDAFRNGVTPTELVKAIRATGESTAVGAEVA